MLNALFYWLEIDINMPRIKTSRRSFLKGSVAVGGAALTASTTANSSEPDPLITEMQEWAQFTGDGVDATPYGLPIDFESDVVRRNVCLLYTSTLPTT